MKKVTTYTTAYMKARYGMGIFSLMFLFSLSAFAQTEGINFQGLARNASDVTTSLAAKVDMVTGKELSTNDYTAAGDKNKLASAVTYTGDTQAVNLGYYIFKLNGPDYVVNELPANGR
jgi:hypothetical protein